MNLGEPPFICLGQYKAIFKQYIFTKNMWTHKDEFKIVPKDEVYGIMILAFQFLEFGLGYSLTVPYLQKIH